MLQSALSIISVLVFVANAQSSRSCRNNYNGYCCHGSIIGSSDDVSDAICCQGDPNDNSINLGSDTTCTAGSAVPLTQVSTMSGGMFGEGTSSTVIVGGTTIIGGDASTTMDTSAMTTPLVSMSASSSGADSITGNSGNTQSTAASTQASAETGTSTGAAAMITLGPLAGSLILAGGWVGANL